MANKNPLRQFYIDHGICVACGQRDAFGGRQKCPECLYKATISNIKYRSLERDRKYYQRQKQKRKARISAGLCPYCGKPAVRGQLCLDHYVKEQKKREKIKEQRRLRGDPREERINKGLCWFCDSPAIGGKKVCQKHYDDIISRFKREEKNHPWVKDNAVIFAKTK